MASKNKNLLHYGVSELEEPIILQLDYAGCWLHKFFEGTRVASSHFKDFTRVETNANTIVTLHVSGEDKYANQRHSTHTHTHTHTRTL
jgi:hypothetical protein